jgi:zinc finger FYVE domain-containing protein 26
MANYIAHEKSCQLWGSEKKLFFSETDDVSSKETDLGCLDSFVENLILERLSFQSPIRVLFEMVPGIGSCDAINLIKNQPVSSDRDADKRYEPKEKNKKNLDYALELLLTDLVLYPAMSMHYNSEFSAE